MKFTLTFALVAAAGLVPSAHAQFGSGIVFDPTQSAHAIQQIEQSSQLYTTTVETTRNVIAAYNLAQHMTTLPQTLYTSFSNLGRQQWTTLTTPANTYGNSLVWMNSASTGYGAASAILATECQTDTFKTKITFDDLLKSALRWRPDRIILGEVRGTEARTLLDSFNTGHSGSLATIHANSAAKALRRFANLVLRSNAQTAFSDIEAEIGEAVDLVIHVDREPGRRVVREVLALTGYDRASQRFQMERVYEAGSTPKVEVKSC
jgi:pilus assembly protein CpaF